MKTHLFLELHLTQHLRKRGLKPLSPTPKAGIFTLNYSLTLSLNSPNRPTRQPSHKLQRNKQSQQQSSPRHQEHSRPLSIKHSHPTKIQPNRKHPSTIHSNYPQLSTLNQPPYNHPHNQHQDKPCTVPYNTSIPPSLWEKICR